MCRIRGTAAGHPHSCPQQNNDDWEPFIAQTEESECHYTNAATEQQQEPEGEPMTPIDPGLVEGYMPLTVEQMEVAAYQEDIARIYDHYTQHKRDH